jgi:hypothetical protein
VQSREVSSDIDGGKNSFQTNRLAEEREGRKTTQRASSLTSAYEGKAEVKKGLCDFR